MQETKLTFKRYEKKYIICPGQYVKFRRELDRYIVPDIYFTSTVCSIYYDTDDFSCIRNSIEGPIYKEKLRLRSYNVPSEDDEVFVELKEKFKGLVYKRRIAMPEREAVKYLAGEAPAPDDGQISREIDWFLKNNDVKPKVYIACEREAYVAENDSELRITFDSDIRWRDERLDLCLGSEGERILPEGQVLMEIKLPQAAPLWLARMLSENELFPVGFSKYGTCYKENIINGVIFSV
ncbi:MAG: polyphosphate polymerase domain-containing protein [Candidatus Limivicinus sp.]|jgi:hypothetical protein